MFTILADIMSQDELDDYLINHIDCVDGNFVLCLYDNEYARVDIQSFIEIYKCENRQIKNDVFEVDYEEHNVVTIVTDALKKKIAEMTA